MFGTIRRHQTWLWAVIITLTIISFVYYFNPTTRTGSPYQGRGGYYGSINGEPITEEQLLDATKDVMLLYLFLSGRGWPDTPEAKRSFDVDKEKYQWLLDLQEQERFGIHVSSETAGRQAQRMLAQLTRGEGPISPTLFVQRVLQPKGLDMTDLERFMRHYRGHEELINLIGTSGKLITPQEVRELYVREHQELDVDAIFVSVTNYLSSVTARPEAISRFYSNELANYHIPARVQVSYVRFNVTNYLAKAQAEITNIAEIVNLNMDQLGTNYTRLGKTPEEARAAIREEVLRRRAMEEARQRANDFARTLLDLEPVQADNLSRLAATNGLTTRVTAPFDDQEPPPGLEVNQDFVRYSFSLTADSPFGEPIAGRDGWYVYALDRKLPSEIPTLDEIREKVVADYKFVQATALARAAGAELSRSLSNNLAQGKSFVSACVAAHIKPTSLPPFSLSTRSLAELPDANLFDLVKRMALSTPVGRLSPFQPTRDGGLMVFVKSQVPIDMARMQGDLPAFYRETLQRRQSEAFNAWFSREAQKGLRDTPLFQPKSPPPNMGAAPKANS